MGSSRHRSNLFHQALARPRDCGSFCNHLPLLVRNHRRDNLRSPGGCLRRSISFIPLCHTKSHACPIRLDHDRLVGGEAWEEDEVEAEVQGEAGADEAEGEGGNR